MYADDAGDRAGRMEEIEERLWMACLVTATENSLARWSLCWGFTCHCVVGVKVDGYGSTHYRLPFKLGRIHGGKALELVNIAILI